MSARLFFDAICHRAGFSPIEHHGNPNDDLALPILRGESSPHHRCEVHFGDVAYQDWRTGR